MCQYNGIQDWYEFQYLAVQGGTRRDSRKGQYSHLKIVDGQPSGGPNPIAYGCAGVAETMDGRKRPLGNCSSTAVPDAVLGNCSRRCSNSCIPAVVPPPSDLHGWWKCKRIVGNNPCPVGRLSAIKCSGAIAPRYILWSRCG